VTLPPSLPCGFEDPGGLRQEKEARSGFNSPGAGGATSPELSGKWEELCLIFYVHTFCRLFPLVRLFAMGIDLNTVGNDDAGCRTFRLDGFKVIL